VNSAEHEHAGSTPTLTVIGRTVLVSRPSMRARREDELAHDVAFELGARSRQPLRSTGFSRRRASRASGLISRGARGAAALVIYKPGRVPPAHGSVTALSAPGYHRRCQLQRGLPPGREPLMDGWRPALLVSENTGSEHDLLGQAWLSDSTIRLRGRYATPDAARLGEIAGGGLSR